MVKRNTHVESEKQTADTQFVDLTISDFSMKVCGTNNNNTIHQPSLQTYKIHTLHGCKRSLSGKCKNIQVRLCICLHIWRNHK